MSLKTIVNNDALLKKIIIAIALVVPVVVTLLRYIPHPDFSDSTRNALYILPLLNAILNGSTFFLLIFALIAVKKKNIALHQKLMTGAMLLSAVFLVSYIAFHYTCYETPYPHGQSFRGLYLFILLTHILLSAAIVPLALYAYARGYARMVEKHKKIVRYAYPMWLYVTATGVIVYLMISPYYTHSPF